MGAASPSSPLSTPLEKGGKTGRVLDKIPRDGRFEAIVHVMATLPAAILGLVATLAFHVRIADIEAAADGPLGVGADG
jgi:hypothetical protein